MANTPKRTMVCVTVQKTCERLIREGATLAQGAPLSVVNVARNGEKLLGAGSDGEALEYLYRISRSVGAEMDVQRSTDVIGTLIDLAKKNQIECIVLGASQGTGAYDFAAVLRAELPEVEIHVVS